MQPKLAGQLSTPAIRHTLSLLPDCIEKLIFVSIHGKALSSRYGITPRLGVLLTGM